MSERKSKEYNSNNDGTIEKTNQLEEKSRTAERWKV